MRICYLPRNIDGAGWYRCLFPANALKAHGVQADMPPFGCFRDGQGPLPLVAGQLPDGWVQVVFGDWPESDIYVMQMPHEEKAPAKIRELQAAGKKVVVELDDDYLHVPRYGKNAYSPYEADPRFLHKCIQVADAVTVSTPSIASAYRHLSKNITVLRNRLHWPMWDKVVPVYEQPWRKVRVGYMGTTEFHSADLETITPWFGKWIRTHPDVEFVAAGDPKIHDILKVPVEQQVTTDAVEFRHHELANVTAVMDIGLVPLARNKFNEGKSYLKGLEYSACGIVPVCTPTQQYRELIRDGVDGLLVDTPRKWQVSLDGLVSKRADLRKMGMAARRKAQDWTYENHIDEWLGFYRSLDPKPARALWIPEPIEAVA